MDERAEISDDWVSLLNQSVTPNTLDCSFPYSVGQQSNKSAFHLGFLLVSSQNIGGMMFFLFLPSHFFNLNAATLCCHIQWLLRCLYRNLYIPDSTASFDDQTSPRTFIEILLSPKKRQSKMSPDSLEMRADWRSQSTERGSKLYSLDVRFIGRDTAWS